MTENPPSVTHVVALSGGKDSTALALRLHELNPDTPYTYVCTPTGDELPDMEAHWRHLEGLLGAPLTRVSHPLGLNGLIDRMGALPNWRQRWCTRYLKIEPYAAWLAAHAPAVSYVGIRADEPTRESGDYSRVGGVEQRYPLREWDWGIGDVLNYLDQRGVTIPKRTDCARCFFQRLGEWRELLKEHPDIYWDAARQETLTGATFRSPGRDQWPADLASLAREFDAGRPIRGDGATLKALQCRACRL